MMVVVKPGKSLFIGVGIAIFAAACGGVSQGAVDVRASEYGNCGLGPGNERLACTKRMTPFRDDEPREGACTAKVENWDPEPPKFCLSRVGLVLCEPTTGSLEGVRAAREKCEVAIKEIDAAARCLLHDTSSAREGDAYVLRRRAPSLSCFVGLEEQRRAASDTIALLDKSMSELREKKAADEAQQVKDLAEAKRSAAAATLLRETAEECRKKVLDQNPACNDARLRDDERKSCAESCAKAGHDEADRTFALALDACVDTFAEKGTAQDCPVRRPAEGFMAGAEFDKRMTACSAECKKKGPAARAQALADKAREASRERFATCIERCEASAQQCYVNWKGGCVGTGPSSCDSRTQCAKRAAPCCRACGANGMTSNLPLRCD